MKCALLAGGMLATALTAAGCPALSDGRAWRVRSVRPRNAVTLPLVGLEVGAGEIEAARRAFDPPPGGRFSFSVTITYLERCAGTEADLVFRAFRFRLPYALRLTPVLDWARSGVDVAHDWPRVSVNYSASLATRNFRQAGAFSIRGDGFETRLAAGPGLVSARVLAVMPVIWQRPLLPAELRSQPELETQIDAAIASAESMLRIEHYARDPAFQRISRSLVSGGLDNACFPPSFSRRLKSARGQTGARQYGLVDALLAIAGPLDCSPKLLDALRDDFARINRQSAARLAAAEMSQVRTLVDRLLHHTPLLAVRPVALVEAVVSSTPGRTALPGVGGGLRFSLLNWIEATAGYSWHIRHRPGEPPGSPFVEVRFRDPFE